MPTQPGPFKLLADFDGVWTDPSHEAKRVREFMVSEWSRMTGAALPEIQGLLEAAEAGVRSKPDENGWLISGRISAYADEDEFVFCNSVGGWLDRIGAIADPRVAAQSAILRSQGLEGFNALASHAFAKMTAEAMAGQVTPMLPAAVATLKALLAAGVDIVITSNSGTDRILDMLAKHAVPVCAHPEVRPGSVRVRGGAGKFLLGDPPRVIRCGERLVETSRPHYEEILRAERPDAVIGDVFTLDLALPMVLARNEPELFPRGLQLILRVRGGTPRWVLDFFREPLAGGVRLVTLEGIQDLPGLLR